MLCLAVQTKVIQHLKPKLSPSFNIEDDVTFKKNLIKLDIFYRDFNQQSITQSPDYPVGRQPLACAFVVTLKK